MSAIIRDPDGHVVDHLHNGYESANCCMCDRLADAMWLAHPEIFICKDCAIDSLPKLIADAISGGVRGAKSTSVFHQLESKVLLNFWRGAAGALQWRSQAGNPANINPRQPCAEVT